MTRSTSFRDSHEHRFSDPDNRRSLSVLEFAETVWAIRRKLGLLIGCNLPPEFEDQADEHCFSFLETLVRARTQSVDWGEVLYGSYGEQHQEPRQAAELILRLAECFGGFVDWSTYVTNAQYDAACNANSDPEWVKNAQVPQTDPDEPEVDAVPTASEYPGPRGYERPLRFVSVNDEPVRVNGLGELTPL
jgi:hypothetical protein